MKSDILRLEVRSSRSPSALPTHSKQPITGFLSGEMGTQENKNDRQTQGKRQREGDHTLTSVKLF